MDGRVHLALFSLHAVQESLRLWRETDLPVKRIAQQRNFNALPDFDCL